MRPAGTYRPTSVLLVENDSMDAQRLTQQLTTSTPPTSLDVRFAVDCCDRLESGLERLALGGVDVVLLDLYLPDARGLEALHQVRQGHAEVPVVVLSEDEDDALGLQILREGAQDYLVKGRCSRETLAHALLAAIERQQVHEALVRSRRSEQVARERCEQQVGALMASNAELRLFTHIVSSSFRIPLEALSTYSRQVYQLYHGKGDRLADTLSNNLVQGVEHLQQFVKGLDEYLSVETAGRPFTACDSKRLFESARARLQYVIGQTQASVRCEALPMVRADAEQITTLFWHLLDNALKFHQDGQAPRVRVYFETWGPEGAFAIHDDGIGIEASNLNAIFKLFHRSHTPGPRSGVGSGLAICRRIVERHGGRLWVESEPGQGTTFYFTLS
ncbi:MAG: ATP-binding protein [Candidatus Tectomicrobia bacterium]|nr:ATP-binding protein [Candidatus Tectomicrobia bacterium]